jgi:hypothetical protein
MRLVASVFAAAVVMYSCETALAQTVATGSITGRVIDTTGERGVSVVT